MGILIITEQNDTAKAMSEYLALKSFSSVVALGMEEAQKNLKLNSFELIITDLESQDDIQKISVQGQGAPMLLMCEIPVKGGFLKGLKLQNLDYIITPFREEELSQKIQALLKPQPNKSMSSGLKGSTPLLSALS